MTIPSILTLSPHLRKSGRQEEEEKDRAPTIEYLSFPDDDPRKATFWKGGGGLAGAKNRVVGRRAAPFSVDRRIPTLSVCRHRRRRRRRFLERIGELRHGSVVLGSWPTTTPRPRFSAASWRLGCAPEQPWRARTEPSHGAVPRLRTIDSHGNEPRSRSRVGGEVEEEEEVGLAKGGGRVVGWSRDGAHRAGSPGKGSGKNGHGPDPPPHSPCQSKSGFRAKLFS